MCVHVPGEWSDTGGGSYSGSGLSGGGAGGYSHSSAGGGTGYRGGRGQPTRAMDSYDDDSAGLYTYIDS